jgi:hypothetical protein
MKTHSAPFWASGELTGESVLLGTPAQLVDAIVHHLDPGTLPLEATRAEARLCLAAVVAQELQNRLLQDAIAAGSFDLSTAPDSTIERLTEPKGPIGRNTEPWTSTVVPLVLIAAEGPYEMPEGAVFLIPSATDIALLSALGRTGMVSVGRLDSAGPARG